MIVNQAYYRLDSDFNDIYDKYFAPKNDEDNLIFTRKSQPKLNQRQQLRFLSEHNFNTPFFGTVLDLFEIFSTRSPYKERKQDMVIVFFDKKSPDISNSCLLPWAEAIDNYADNFAMEYVPSNNDERPLSTIIKQVHLGAECICVKQTNFTTSRAKNEVVSRLQPFLSHQIRLPLWSVDFITTNEDIAYAISFDPAPCVVDLGIEKNLSCREMYTAIVDALSYYALNNVKLGILE